MPTLGSRHSLAIMAMTCLVVVAGCRHAGRHKPRTPTQAGLNTRDLITPESQAEYERIASLPNLNRNAARLREQIRLESPAKNQAVLCLSGGGSYGAYSAGYLCGWSERGDRPEFAVVTGISTGALIAPFAFLGPQYDPSIRELYTTLTTRDVYRRQVVRGLLAGGSLADNSRLERKIDEFLTPELMQGIATQHRRGRRLYVATTEIEGKRLVIWDIGAIASHGRECDRQLVKLVLLGSSAIPGFFPPTEIPITVNEKPYIERHVDGGVTQSLFFAPPYVPPELATDPTATSLNGTDVYCIIAGKLYSDPEVVRPRLFTIAGKSVAVVLAAQARGDLARLWTVAQFTGMNFHMTAIREDFPTPGSSTDFDPEAMTCLFEEGVREARMGQWRTSPPGVEPGEPNLLRDGKNLMLVPRGSSTIRTPSP
jgi:predicted patatin/cPLA2 family phospholipase